MAKDGNEGKREVQQDIEILGYDGPELNPGDRIKIVCVYAWGPTSGKGGQYKRYGARFIRK